MSSATTDDGLTKDIQASIDDLENKQKQHAQQQAQAQQQQQQQPPTDQDQDQDQDGDHQMMDVDVDVEVDLGDGVDADDSTNLVSQTAIDNELSKLGVDEATAAAEEAVKAAEAEAEAAAVVEAQLKLYDHQHHHNDNQEQQTDNVNVNANEEGHKTNGQLSEFKALQSSEHTSLSSQTHQTHQTHQQQEQEQQQQQQQEHEQQQEAAIPMNEIFKGREFFVITKNKSGDTIYLNIEQLGGKLVEFFTEGCIALAKGSSSLSSDIDYDVYSYSLIYAAEREKCVPDFEKYRLRRANKLTANLDIDFGDYAAAAAAAAADGIGVGVEGVTGEDGVGGAIGEEGKENGAHQGIDAVIENVGKHVEQTTSEKVDEQLKQSDHGTSKVEPEPSTSNDNTAATAVTASEAATAAASDAIAAATTTTDIVGLPSAPMPTHGSGSMDKKSDIKDQLIDSGIATAVNNNNTNSNNTNSNNNTTQINNTNVGLIPDPAAAILSVMTTSTQKKRSSKFTELEDAAILELVRRNPSLRSTHSFYSKIATLPILSGHTGNSIRFRFRKILAKDLGYVYDIDPKTNQPKVDPETNELVRKHELPSLLKSQYTADEDFLLCTQILDYKKNSQGYTRKRKMDTTSIPESVFMTLVEKNPRHSAIK
ncbi:unnamed protein product [Ambrosiozyma monospora]|uniref:Unnamed protein product n=1 Tax=Ambrosiozyma monospora TaxID=43982 RepID=A0A9W6YXJ6_AMBMO|nr:unnamed protein product [Ambrosiozyma monospora]